MRRSPLLAVYLTVFIDLLGFSIILPLLPYYAEKYGASGVWVGALLTAYSAVQFLSAPVLGRLSDHYGRRPLLLLSLAGSALSLALSGLAASLWLLLLARALAGLFGGSISTAQAYVADLTEPRERAKFMGMLGAAIGLGFTFGPAIGAGLKPLGFGAAAFFAAGLAALNLIFAWFRLPETRRRRGSGRAWPTPAILRSLAARPAQARIVAAMFCAQFGFVGFEATFALFGQRRFGLDAAGFGLVFTFVGVIGLIVQGGLIGRLVPRYGERSLAVGGAMLIALALAGLTVAPVLVVAFVLLGMLALGQGLVSPTLSALLSRSTDAESQGQALGVGQSMAALARAIGPLIAGGLFDIRRGLPYWVGGLVVLGAAAVLVERQDPALTPHGAGD